MVEIEGSNRRGLKKRVITVCECLIVLIVGFAVWMLYFSISTHTDRIAQKARSTIARNIATHVQNNFSTYSDPLIKLAKYRKTIQLFQQGDDKALLAAAKKNQTLFKNALKLRYIKPDNYELDDVSVPPLGYASLNMMKKAELTSKINTEVHLFGDINQHIVLVRRVNNNAFELVGLLHLSLSTDLLDGLFDGLDIGDGYAELLQGVIGENLILARFGNQSARQGKAIVARVYGTRWSIKYWPAEIDAITIQKILMMALLLIISVVLIIVLLVKGRALMTQLDEDQK